MLLYEDEIRSVEGPYGCSSDCEARSACLGETVTSALQSPRPPPWSRAAAPPATFRATRTEQNATKLERFVTNAITLRYGYRSTREAVYVLYLYP